MRGGSSYHDENQDGHQNIAQNTFSRDRASLLGHVPRRTVNNERIVKKNKKNVHYFVGVDTPRAFRRNVDMVSSNTSGAKFKRSSDLTPEEKIEIEKMKERNGYNDITRKPMPSIDGMAMTKISRQAESAPVPTGLTALRSTQEPSHEAVMSWLLTHLPQLQEEDAISYFHALIDDGFDSIDALCYVLEEEDLSFMKEDHQIELLLSVQSTKLK